MLILLVLWSWGGENWDDKICYLVGKVLVYTQENLETQFVFMSSNLRILHCPPILKMLLRETHIFEIKKYIFEIGSDNFVKNLYLS